MTIPQGYILTSDSPALVTLTVEPSATVAGCEFNNVRFQGTADGNNIIRECLLLDVDYVSGFVFQCSLEGTVSIVPGALCALLSCFSNTLAGQPNPKLDFNGSGKVILRDYQGAIELLNHTDDSGDGDLCLDFSSGVCIIRPSVTAGFIPVRGICRVVNQSTGTANVVDETVQSLINTNAASLEVINQGIKRSSLLIPHTTDL